MTNSEEFGRQMDALVQELDALENAAKRANRLRLTPLVDDDFPQVKFEYDQSVRSLIDVLRRTHPRRW